MSSWKETLEARSVRGIPKKTASRVRSVGPETLAALLVTSNSEIPIQLAYATCRVTWEALRACGNYKSVTQSTLATVDFRASRPKHRAGCYVSLPPACPDDMQKSILNVIFVNRQKTLEMSLHSLGNASSGGRKNNNMTSYFYSETQHHADLCEDVDGKDTYP